MGPQAQRSVRPPRCICRRGKDVRGRKFALGPGAALSDRREFAEPGSGFSKFSASYSLFPSETAPWGRTLRCDWGSYPPVLFKRKFPVPITLPVLSRRHPGEFSESRGKIMRILKSNVIVSSAIALSILDFRMNCFSVIPVPSWKREERYLSL